MLLIVVINCLLIGMVVMFHYEALRYTSKFMPRLHLKYRLRIVLGVAIALVAHCVEIWLFALAYYLLPAYLGWGQLLGAIDGSLLDCVYFSFTVFTTVGFGDILPAGDIRYLVGLESLTGLVLITWTASFLFVEMQRYWNE